MLIRRFARIVLVFVLLFATGVAANAATALLTYDFDVEIDTATGTNIWGLVAGDTVHMNIVLDKDNPDSIEAPYSMYGTINNGLVSLELTLETPTKTSIYTKDDDTGYGYPIVTIRNDDLTIDTIDFLVTDTYLDGDEEKTFYILIGYDYTAGEVLTSVWAQDGSWSFSGDIPLDIAPVPVPGTALLLGAGFLGLCGIRRKRRS